MIVATNTTPDAADPRTLGAEESALGRPLQLFFVANRYDGMVVARSLNWTGQVLKVPRRDLTQALRRDEAAYSGVYVLLGEEDGEVVAYVGESDNLSSRLKAQAADKDWWTTALLITAGENKLDKTHIKYLEARLIDEALKLGLVRMDNATQPLPQGLGEADLADLERFLNDLLLVLAALGVERLLTRRRRATRTDQPPIHDVAKYAYSKSPARSGARPPAHRTRG